MERGTLFGIPDVLGLQPGPAPALLDLHPRDEPNSVFYNAAVIGLPSLRERPADGRPVPGRADGGRRRSPRAGSSRAPTTTTWCRCTAGSRASRSSTRGRGSTGRRDALERRPGPRLRPAHGPRTSSRIPGIAATTDAAPGSAEYREVTPEDVRITVDDRLAGAGGGAEQLRRGMVGDGGRPARAAARDRLPRPGGRGPCRDARDPARLSRRRRRPRLRSPARWSSGASSPVDPRGAAPGTRALTERRLAVAPDPPQLPDAFVDSD